jgi:hypothetical protein
MAVLERFSESHSFSSRSGKYKLVYCLEKRSRLTDMKPRTHTLRIQLVENPDIVAIRELLLDV